jgi:hypothetical protein
MEENERSQALGTVPGTGILAYLYDKNEKEMKKLQGFALDPL